MDLETQKNKIALVEYDGSIFTKAEIGNIIDIQTRRRRREIVAAKFGEGCFRKYTSYLSNGALIYPTKPGKHLPFETEHLEYNQLSKAVYLPDGSLFSIGQLKVDEWFCKKDKNGHLAKGPHGQELQRNYDKKAAILASKYKDLMDLIIDDVFDGHIITKCSEPDHEWSKLLFGDVALVFHKVSESFDIWIGSGFRLNSLNIDHTIGESAEAYRESIVRAIDFYVHEILCTKNNWKDEVPVDVKTDILPASLNTDE